MKDQDFNTAKYFTHTTLKFQIAILPNEQKINLKYLLSKEQLLAYFSEV